MIPIKLQLKNFVSYGAMAQTINFEPYQLICLSGKNGHGKSALLDALTWVLWGQARKSVGMNKADDAVLRLGQTNMFVALDFSCGNQQYRVRREYAVTGHKANTTLELGIIDQQTGFFKPLTDKTIKTTQDKINNILGIDYDAFINSAFLRQGQSNEFSKKSPKERKEILASILRLEQFERIKKRASEKAKDAQSQREHLTLNQTKLTQEIERKSGVQEQLTQITESLNILLNQELDYKKTALELKENQNQINQIRQQHEIIAFKISQVTQKFNDQFAGFKQELLQWRSILYKQQTVQNYQTIVAERSTLETLLGTLQARTQQYLSLKEHYVQIKEQENNYIQAFGKKMQDQTDRFRAQENNIAIVRTKLGEQLRETKNRKLLSVHETEKYTLESEKLRQSLHNNTLQFPENELQQLEAQLDKRKAQYHKWLHYLEKLPAELKSLEDKIALTQSAEQPQCPLCLQDLAPEHKHKIIEELTQRIVLLNHQMTRLHKFIASLRQKIQDNIDLSERQKKQQLDNQTCIIKLEEITKQLEKIATDKINLDAVCIELEAADLKQITELEQLKKQINEFQATHTLEQDPEYRNFKFKLTEIHQKVIALNYKPHEEKETQERLALLNNRAKEQAQLQIELAGQADRKQRITQYIARLKQYKTERAQLETELVKFTGFKQQEIALLTQEQDLHAKITQINQQKEQLILKKGALEQELKAFAVKEQEFGANQKQLVLLEHLCDEYQAIASALGKDGVQALLIEDVIPEIEHEANKLLARLTDNQAHLSIESLRDLRSGGTKETLDIKISDAVGIRPYELFSGGEAFRIDFALRIAISKLLAHRAGTALQTLIIDEGFGSQDEEGLAHIMDAILKIQEDFAKIIVVSHLPSLKDQFPVHFYIHKGPDGSAIKVIEND